MKVEVIAKSIINRKEYAKGVTIDTKNEPESMKKLKTLFHSCVLTEKLIADGLKTEGAI